MNNTSVCQKIEGDEYEKVILDHRKKRHDMLMHLANIAKIINKNSVYINMELLQNFEKLFV